MFKPEFPGDFGKTLLSITKKLRSQNRWLKIGLGVLSITTLVLYIRSLIKNESESVLPKEPEKLPDESAKS